MKTRQLKMACLSALIYQYLEWEVDDNIIRMKTRQLKMACLSALIYQYLEWEVDDNIIRGQFGNIWFLGYLILSALITTDDDPRENADLYVTYVIQVAYADVQFCRLHCECISCNLILSALLTTDDPRENDDNSTCYIRCLVRSVPLSNNSEGSQNEVSKSPNKSNGLCQMCKSLCRETSLTSDPVDAGHRRASPIKESSLRLAIEELAYTNCICDKSSFFILAFIIGHLPAVYLMKEWVFRKMMVFNILNKDIKKEITDGWDREAVRDMASGPQDVAVKKHKRCKSEPNIYTGTGIQKHLLCFCAENSIGSQNPANNIGRSNINCYPDIDTSTFANPLNNQKSKLSFKKPVLISVFNSLNSQDISVPYICNIKAIQNSLSKTSTVGTENVYRKHIGTQTEIIINSYRNLLGGEWDRQKTFDENGGELRKARSAVTLLVPTGAINANQVSTIYGKVFADLEKVSQVVKLWPNYRFISPVVEFISGGQTKYSKHLRIRMPIASKWNEKSSVICFPGRGDYSVSEVPTLNKNKQTLPDMYYEKEEGFINIFTRHFTAFACVSCDRQNLSLSGIVFGCLKPLEVSLRLYICDSLSAIPDILEPLREKEENIFGRLLLDLKPIKLIKPSPNDLLLVSIETSNKWKLKTKPDGSCLFPIYENTLADFHYCSSDRILYDWTYHRNSTLSKDGFGCCINAKVGNRRTTFDISIPVDERDTTRKFTGPFTEIEKLLTTNADHDKMRDIARHLEVDETKLKDLHKNNKGDTTGAKHAIFELCVNKHGSDFPEKLKAALEAMHEKRLLEIIFPKDLKIEIQV